MNKLKILFHKISEWIKINVLQKDMLIFILIAELIFWSPCIVTGILAIVATPWWWSIFSAIIAFWAGPLTPAFPLQMGLAVILKKLYQKIKNKPH